jgi:hypothetical protein
LNSGYALPLFLIIVAVFSMALHPLKLAPYDSLTVKPINGSCNSKIQSCEIEINVLKLNRWEKLNSQPIEVRTKCKDVTKIHYSKSFTFPVDSCENGSLEVFAIPLLFGFTAAPEDDVIFERYKASWFKLLA